MRRVRSGSDKSATEFPWVASEGQERAVSTVQFQSVTSASDSVTARPDGAERDETEAKGVRRRSMRGRSSVG